VRVDRGASWDFTFPGADDFPVVTLGDVTLSNCLDEPLDVSARLVLAVSGSPELVVNPESVLRTDYGEAISKVPWDLPAEPLKFPMTLRVNETYRGWVGFCVNAYTIARMVGDDEEVMLDAKLRIERNSTGEVINSNSFKLGAANFIFYSRRHTVGAPKVTLQWAKKKGDSLSVYLVNRGDSTVRNCKAELVDLRYWNKDRYQSDSAPRNGVIFDGWLIDPEDLDRQRRTQPLVIHDGKGFTIRCHHPSTANVTRGTPGIWTMTIRLIAGEQKPQTSLMHFSWQPKRDPVLMIEESPTKPLAWISHGE
jgi:hypothetical protein